VVWLRDRMHLVRDAEGGARQLRGVMVDTTSRKQAEEALRNLAEAVSPVTGAAFFRTLVQRLAKTLGPDYVFVGELAGENWDTIKTIAVCAAGEIIENFEYPLRDTPCETVVGKALCSYPQGVRQQFPRDRLLAEMGVEGYVGAPLHDSAGRPSGLLVVMARKALGNAEFVERVLRVFAARAAAELERMRAEEERARLSLAVEQAAESIAVTKPDGTIVYVNAAFERVTGYPPAEALGQTMRLIKSGKQSQAYYEHMWQTILSGQVWRGEVVNRRKNGELFVEEQSIAPLRDERGEITYFVSVGQDITQRKRAEERTQVLLDVAKDCSGTLDLTEILDRVQRRTIEVVPCDRAATFYWDTANELFRMAAQYGTPEGLLPDVAAVQFRPREPIADALGAGQTVVINRIDEQGWLPTKLLAHFGITALVAVPLAVRSRMLGALVAFSAESGRRFDANQVQLLEGIARQVAAAIGTAELYRAQHEEAEVAGALARVGRELMAALGSPGSPGLLDRLCQLTAELLACDCSHTFLWKTAEEVYVPVSHHGDSAEQWESLRTLKIPGAILGGLLARLERDGVVQVVVADPQDLILPGLPAQDGISVAMYVALRRGREMFGILAAGFRGRQEPFAAQQERIARGIGQLGSVALENARLVDELELANQLKSNFLATMSHELRTPLNIIMGYNGLLLERDFGPVTAEQVEALRTVDKSARGLLELIDGILDLTQLDAGQEPLELKEIDLPELISEIDAETSHLREKPNLSFVWDVAAQLPRLQTDPLKLKVVLKNLIANAAKFTEQGSVTVSIAGRDGGAEISVADTGTGIAPEALPIIFEPFRQADGSMTRQYGGVGLGLHIARRLLELLGGTITVDSEVGRGSTFRVWVPTSTPPSRRAA
jgi:PAS domain S-box-containing protein